MGGVGLLITFSRYWIRIVGTGEDVSTQLSESDVVELGSQVGCRLEDDTTTVHLLRSSLLRSSCSLGIERHSEGPQLRDLDWVTLEQVVLKLIYHSMHR